MIGDRDYLAQKYRNWFHFFEKCDRDLPRPKISWSISSKNRFMFFDRYEIHIQAFAKIPPANLMSGDSSSSTFHDFIILSYYNYQKSRNSEFQKFKKWKAKVSKISKILKFRILRKIFFHFFQGCSLIFS